MSDIEVLGKLTRIFNKLRKDDEEGHSSAYELQWEDISTIENLIIENKKLIQENKELEKENFNLKEKQIIDKCEVPIQDNFYDYYAQNYLQIPVSFLTEENLDWLEQHCEKAIRYATRNELKEHQITLELIVKYKEMNKEIRELKEKNNRIKSLDYTTLAEEMEMGLWMPRADVEEYYIPIENLKDYIPKSKVKEKIEYHKKIDNPVAIMILEKLLED